MKNQFIDYQSGFQDGQRKKAIEIAINLLKKKELNIDIELLSNLTGLSLETAEIVYNIYFETQNITQRNADKTIEEYHSSYRR